MNYPTSRVARLLTDGEVVQVGTLVLNLSDLYRTDPTRACALALRRSRAYPHRDRLEICNKLLGMYGTEAIRGEWQNGFWGSTVAAFCNTGDTYALTIVEVRGDWSGASSRFVITSWGDWVERNEKRLAIV